MVLGISVSIGALALVGYVIAVAATAPDIDELRAKDAGQTSVVYAADGSRLGFVQSDVIRTPIRYRKIPRVMRDAAVAIEDRNFWEHEGVDYSAIIRAGVENISSGETVQGGSTITQQLARALYIQDPADTYQRKIREAKLAQELEERRSKRWILGHYLNVVPFGTLNGSTALGVDAASEVFFSKDAKDLKLHEAALLAGLPQAPSEYNPLRQKEAALRRRNEVLTSMAELGMITQSKAEKASRRDLGVNPSDEYTERRDPYVFDYVQDELIEEYGVETVRRGGLEVHTTIEPDVQEIAEGAVEAPFGFEGSPSGALVSIDPSNGAIRAMASSAEYEDRRFNLASQGHRQPGSAFKTMALVTAVREGIDPDSTTYVSRPLSLSNEYGAYEVSTYDDSYGGSMTLTEATLQSDNTVYAQLALDLGPEDIAETAHDLGIESELQGLPAETLGGLEVGVTPLEMANAYATLASGGVRHDAHAVGRVRFPNGEVDRFGSGEGRRVLSKGEAAEVTRILGENIASGTGTGASIGCSDGQAGKTGTTDEFKDAWFVGYTTNLSTAVWIGYPDAALPTGISGGETPATIWNSFMSSANGECEPFPFADASVSLSGGTGDVAETAVPTEETAPATPSSQTAPTDPAAPAQPELYAEPPIEPPPIPEG